MSPRDKNILSMCVCVCAYSMCENVYEAEKKKKNYNLLLHTW